ncbi:hypothetical protein AA105894_1878 [Asaia spathodeae NBRC 105894]|nr:hypothetical protein AA105894_1878 [Asaia spathodeae NBRC 105894]
MLIDRSPYHWRILVRIKRQAPDRTNDAGAVFCRRIAAGQQTHGKQEKRA